MSLLRRSRAAAFTLLLAVLLPTGCIEFDRQTLRYRVDAETDTLKIFQDYQGIYGAEHGDRLSDQEVDQLRSVLEGERTFFFANWIFEFNVRQMEEASDSIGADASSVKERALASRMRQAVRTLRENLTINNGTFYLDAKGHLGGVQRVRIGNLSRVVDTVNDGLHAFIELRLLSHKLDPEEQPLYRRALTDPSAFLTVKGNRLTFRFPMSEAAFRREIAKPETDDADLRRLRQAEIHVTHADGEFRVIIGREDERVTTISLDTFEKPYRPNVLRHLETKGTPIPATFHPARAASEYLGPR